MPQGGCDCRLRRIGLLLATIADPDLRACKATAGEEGLKAQLIALPHRGIDFLAGEAVDQCLVLCLVGHIGLFGQGQNPSSSIHRLEPRADDGRKQGGAQLRVARRCLRLRAYACCCGLSGVVLMWR